MKNFIYKLGGYDPEIIQEIKMVTADGFGKYIITGLALLIVCITASFGGWHLTDTLIPEKVLVGEYEVRVAIHILSTVVFASLIFMLDYIILSSSGNSRAALWGRGTLAVFLGLFIAVLASLTFNDKAIQASINRNENMETNPINKKYELILQDYSNDIRKLEKRQDSIINLIGDETRGILTGKLGRGPVVRSLVTDSATLTILLSEKRKKYDQLSDSLNTVKNREIANINREYTNDIIPQVHELVKLMKNDNAVLFFVILTIIILILLDTIPLLVKIGMNRDTEDNQNDSMYIKITKQLNDWMIEGTITEEDKKPILKRLIERTQYKYNIADKELKKKKNQIKRENETLDRDDKKNENEHKHVMFNEDALLEVNLAYSLEQYSKLIEEFQYERTIEIIGILKQQIEELHKKKE
jgi:hypothetical protein